MRELALFAGAGGGILGGHLLGWRTVCAVEFDAYARNVLLARQRDGCLPRFPIWDDVRTFDGKPWRGSVDVVSGGFPCQDISAAGRGAGITGERSGLWKHMARIIGEVRPRYAWVENSPLLVGRGLAVVLGDLAEMGYDARWGIVGADDAGAPHGRKRIWILAYSMRDGRKADHRWQSVPDQDWDHSPHAGGRKVEQQGADCNGSALANSDGQRGRSGQTWRQHAEDAWESSRDQAKLGWWDSEPHLGGVAHGLASPLDIHGAHASGNVGRVGVRIPKRADRIRCIGNGQVPASMVLAFRTLMADLNN